MSKRPKLLFYFLHLLGVGHVHRAKRLIDGFHTAGIDTNIIYGGDPLPGIEFPGCSVCYLPPIRAADSTYQNYLDQDGKPLEKAYLDLRQDKLIKFVQDQTPDVVLVEAFPFGRRMVRHELRAMFDELAIRSTPPLVVTSVRDILQKRKKPQRYEETVGTIQKYISKVLVHSDPEIIPLGETFPLASRIADKIEYTGFVLPPSTTGSTEPADFDVLVSAGGGAFGGDLMKTCLQTASHFPGQTWCLLTGPNLSAIERERLKQTAPTNVTVKERVDDLAAWMSKSRVSISQCGYNTAMDVLSIHHKSRCRAIFVPFDTQGQTEQLHRARLLAKAGFAINLPQSQLDATALKLAVDQAMKLPASPIHPDLSGVETTASTILNWLGERHG